MKKLLLLLVFVYMAYGCSIFKQREVTKSQSQSSTKTDVKIKSDSTAKVIEKTVITEIEKVDTVAKTKPVKAESETEFDLQKLINGLTTIDSGLVTVKLTLDTATNKLKTVVDVKPQDVKVTVQKTRETKRDVTTSTSTSLQKDSAVATEAKQSNKGTIAKPKGLGWLWGIAVAGFIILAGLIIYLAKRYLPKKASS